MLRNRPILPAIARLGLLAIYAFVLVRGTPVEASSIVAAYDDAFIAHDESSDVWSIGSRDLEIVIGFDSSGRLTLRRAINPLTGHDWNLGPAIDTSFAAGGDRVALSTRGATSFLGALGEATTDGVRLAFGFEHAGLGLRIWRTYVVYAGSPAVEMWTRIDASGGTPRELSQMVGWQVDVPAATVRWVGGLRSYAESGELEPFEVKEGDLDPGESLEIGSDNRSSEIYIPFIVVDDGTDAFFGGVMWSGAWRITAARTGDRMQVTAHFPERPAASSTRSIEMPHTFLGFTSRPAGTPQSAVAAFVSRGLRHGRPLEPQVTYNTWFAYGTTVSEQNVIAEIDYAARIGVELFVLDAGWYVGAGANNDSDFTGGLGGLDPDEYRFPSGLAALSDYARSQGIKFGLWLEPERVALEMIELVGLNEGWLAKRDGEYGFEGVAQVCLGGASARRWLIDRLVQLIESVNPDYIKWDNNGWTNCNRTGHGHGPNDGNFSHVEGLYDVLRQLRERFPNLLIENVSGGGNRMDFGMIGLTDVAWMDDKSWPSSHVRHNLEGLSSVLPPAYLLSFVIAGGGEEIDMGNDLSHIMRSRMPGVLGLTFRAAEIEPDALAWIGREIVRYKAYRDLIGRGTAVLLSAQAPVTDGWDALELVEEGGSNAVLFAFKNEIGEGRVLVRPRGLLPDVTYEVQSADVGILGTATGSVLMEEGIEIVHLDGSLAHVIALVAQPSIYLPSRRPARRR